MVLSENYYWSSVRTNFQWDLFSPDLSQKYTIQIFDDGLDMYQPYVNKWHIHGVWKRKVALVNACDHNIHIGSISQWKMFGMKHMECEEKQGKPI
jgi:hypothetical protein